MFYGTIIIDIIEKVVFMYNDLKMQKVYLKQILVLEKKKDYDGVKVFSFVAAKMGIDTNYTCIEISSLAGMKITDNLCFALTSLLKSCSHHDQDVLLLLLTDLGFLVLSNNYVTTSESWDKTRKILADAFRGLGIGVNCSK